MFVSIMSALKKMTDGLNMLPFSTRCLHYIGINRKTEFLLETVCLQISLVVTNKMK